MGNTDMNLFRDEELEEVKLTPGESYMSWFGIQKATMHVVHTSVMNCERNCLNYAKLKDFLSERMMILSTFPEPPIYTACPNPWLNDFIAEWEQDKSGVGKTRKA